MLLQRDKSLLLMVDFQTGLLPVIDGGQDAVIEANWLAEMACLLGVPVWLTEQNPEKLGATQPTLLASLNDYRLWQKQYFGAMAEVQFREALNATGKKQIVLCGTEAHICVLQTGLGLLEAGYELYWLVEACASRRPQEATFARERACASGAVAVTADMVAYEWLHRCDTALFKEAHQRFLKPRSSRSLQFS
ncbi:isochorismatase family protein [Halovibrio sp. HP20-50]|uniref:isochorismatase family protein n=1 Tax=Halovibrio sp. HP20-59 TaxID=3080275 RepID=UPI00294B7165|nr:isochorismatase family protein [Halovibrio sp. HP20-59]MEA2118494.1 isochorismatase family protein [Halovibrio sp. HP20-59]